MTRPHAILFSLVLLTAIGGDGRAEAATPTAPARSASSCATDASPAGVVADLAVPGFADRSHDLRLPPNHRCGDPIGVVLVFHGGGGNKENMRTLTCPGGDVASDGCLDRTALAAGFAVVFANGTAARGGRLLSAGGIRTWNAGGGGDGWICVSGNACTSGVDDIAYVRALLADLSGRIAVDPRRVHATGFSNGAAMAHRLACEMADTFAAVAAVGGQNQFARNDGCAPGRPVAVLSVHGTLDRCWPYEGGEGGCVQSGRYVSVAASLAGWASRNGCDATPVERAPAPRASSGGGNGTQVIRFAYPGCRSGGAVEHLRVVGHGHYWPGGHSYARSALLGGTMSRELDTARAVVDFFVAHARP